MLVEQDRIVEQKRSWAEEVKFLKEVIARAEGYERLLLNKDFQNYVQDVKDRIAAHEANIQSLLRQITSASSPFKRLRLSDVIQQHQIRKEECEALVGFPETTKNAKEESMQRLDEINKLEKEIPNV